MIDRVTCSDCRVDIPPADIDVGEGVAYCRACGVRHRLADMLLGAEAGIRSMETPPPGCRMEADGEHTSVRVRAGTISASLMGLLFTAIFGGCTSFFVLMVVAATMLLTTGAIPAWMPAHAASGAAQFGTSMGMIIFLWLFMTPFVLASLVLLWISLTCLVGRVEVRICDDRGVVLSGFGPIVWRRRFDPRRVKSVRSNGRTHVSPIVLELESDKTMQLGSDITNTRAAWMLIMLRRLLPGVLR